jgi:hypothetical protein
MAALVKCSTITILVNDVSIMRIEGATERIVNIMSIWSTVDKSVPSPDDIPTLIKFVVLSEA